MNLGIIIQARLGSTRLPGKILKPFHGDKCILDIILDKLHQASDAKVIVATSTSIDNDALVEHLKRNGELFFRGSENDVLDRFIKAAEKFHVDGVIRICSDNPFIDPDGIKTLSEKARHSEAQYIGFRINGLPSIKTHFGFWGEFVTLDALKKVAASTDDLPAHEHVTIHIYSHPEEYPCEWIDCLDFIQGRNDIRLTVDTQEDFKNAQQVYADLTKANHNFGLEEIVSYIDEHEEMKASMKRIITQNTK
jgi:spore coat polysaccharide biosynthesis protein SpsF